MDITLDDRLNVLQQISQRKFVEILDAIPGTKDLVIEQKLMKILDSFIGVSILKRYGVEKIYKMEQGLKLTNSQHIFLVSSDLIACKRVLDQIQSEISLNMRPRLQPNHHILVTPFVPTVLGSIIEEEGLSGLVTLQTLCWEFIRLDGNILSLENAMFIDLYYHKDTTLLPALARCLWSLQLIVGAPKLTVSIGKYSQQLLKIMESMKQCLGSSNIENEIGTLILMDRNYDFATSLLTPVTYVGLLHEVIDINVGVGILGKSQTKLDPDKDQIYREVRDTPCSDVFPILHGKAKSLKSEQDAIQTMKLSEMEKYVSTKLQKTRDLTRHLAFHISACQLIADTLGSDFQTLQKIEKCILECRERKECFNYIERYIDDHPLRTLRLLCLLSIVSDGITQNELHSIQKVHLHAHGYRHTPLFYKLQSIGLLRYRAENIFHKLPNWTSEWNNNAQKLKLFPSTSKQAEQQSRSCPSYVFNNAYIPLIAQVLNAIVNQEKDPKNLEELANLSNCVINGQRGSLLPKMVVICIIGGITYAEITACRFIEKSTGIRLVLASDSIITGNKMLEKVQEI
ncbi:vacuolar protein sorting 33B isoform X2 [Megachile rotundata]|uniref:vacuolar protein sorting 33B isoform X2 n=1 Tax=Megachile rotundata TaxID=143995 RepID=UPI00061524AD|nr:PREDICTED: vacuolar protein sorting-associated protein 33B isoform X2 [Megachile rotundata]